jgi:hypothetical protein
MGGAAGAQFGRGSTSANWTAPGALALVLAVPDADPSSPAVGRTTNRLKSAQSAGTLVGGAAAENYDLEAALAPIRTGLDIA